jgi:hypothetical protein
MDEFLCTEVKYLETLRNAMQWHSNQKSSLSEKSCQMLFTVYLQGLIDALQSRTLGMQELQVYAATTTLFKCKLIGEKPFTLRGHTDFCVEKERKQSSNQYLSGSAVIAEMKRIGGALEQEATRNAARDQLIGQLFTVNIMRSTSKSVSTRSKSIPIRGFLTDVKRIMIAFCFCIDKETHSVALSSTIQEPADYICYLLFILMDHDEECTDNIFRSLKADGSIDIDADDEPQEKKIDELITPTSLNSVIKADGKTSGGKHKRVSRGNRHRAFEVIDLNAGDSEEEREEQIRVLYEHDALCHGYYYFHKENLQNRSLVGSSVCSS